MKTSSSKFVVTHKQFIHTELSNIRFFNFPHIGICNACHIVTDRQLIKIKVLDNSNTTIWEVKTLDILITKINDSRFIYHCNFENINGIFCQTLLQTPTVYLSFDIYEDANIYDAPKIPGEVYFLISNIKII